MKELLIDLYKIKDPYSGLGQFSLNFGNELATRKQDEFRKHFLVPSNSKKQLWEGRVHQVSTSLLKRYLPSTNKTYDIWHSLHQLPSFVPNHRTPWILTVHDLNFLVEKSESKAKSYLSRLQKNVDKASCITTISHFTKGEIEKHLDLRGKEVHVIYNGVSSGKDITKTKPSFISSGKFFFSIGVFAKKKNFEVLLPLMKKFPDHQLVIAGNKNTAYGKEIERQITAMNIQAKVLLPGKITDSEKQWLYAHCEAFLFPSLAEGFGLPAIEAMHEGAPVFLSKHTSLPEIGGDMAFYFDDFEPNTMADKVNFGLREIGKDNDLFKRRSIKHAGQFSWGKCIDAYMEVYRKL